VIGYADPGQSRCDRQFPVDGMHRLLSICGFPVGVSVCFIAIKQVPQNELRARL
jgi:phosphoribosylcarboxyaminoimidazole (NCAIR) mutase